MTHNHRSLCTMKICDIRYALCDEIQYLQRLCGKLQQKCFWLLQVYCFEAYFVMKCHPRMYNLKNIETEFMINAIHWKQCMCFLEILYKREIFCRGQLQTVAKPRHKKQTCAYPKNRNSKPLLGSNLKNNKS